MTHMITCHFDFDIQVKVMIIITLKGVNFCTKLLHNNFYFCMKKILLKRISFESDNKAPLFTV